MTPPARADKGVLESAGRSAEGRRRGWRRQVSQRYRRMAHSRRRIDAGVEQRSRSCRAGVLSGAPWAADLYWSVTVSR
ncbi:hypothetical protein KCP73_08345 [Salmonella enterica subsp. enterica]|nr:hypothetical protein KCP73_08345 [Salmonella enterica subsp. enterica]